MRGSGQELCGPGPGWGGRVGAGGAGRGRGGAGRDALEGKGPQRRPQEQLERRLEEVSKAVGGSYCRLQMPLTLELGVRGTMAGHRLGALGTPHPLFQCIPGHGAPGSGNPRPPTPPQPIRMKALVLPPTLLWDTPLPQARASGPQDSAGRCGGMGLTPRVQRRARPMNTWCSNHINLLPHLIRYRVSEYMI